MQHFYVLIGLGLFVLLNMLWSLRSLLKRGLADPYVVEARLCEPPQRDFLARLEQVLGRDYRVFAKVRVADVIGVMPRLSRREQERAYARLGEGCFDFLVCDRESTAILCAIDLVPRTRWRKAAVRGALDRICAAAGLPYIGLAPEEVHAVAEVRERILAVMPARGMRYSEDEVSLDEAVSMLHGLSRVIGEEQAASRTAARRVRTSQPRGLPSTNRRLARDPSPAPSKPTRGWEPVIRDPDILDDEPVFKIDIDLEDESPTRARRFRAL